MSPAESEVAGLDGFAASFPLLTAMLLDPVYKARWFADASVVIRAAAAHQGADGDSAGAVLNGYRAAFAVIDQITTFHKRRIQHA